MNTSYGPKEKAGVIAYRLEQGEELQILLITSRKFKDSWVLPGGSVEPGETFEDAAMRECAEESGYEVNLGMMLPAFEVLNPRKPIRFTYYLATVARNTEQWETDRKREWFPAGKVPDLVPDIFRPVVLDAIQHLSHTIPK